ncbi:hypothetical protein YB2330_002761 [Saitoella coloradoensis]
MPNFTSSIQTTRTFQSLPTEIVEHICSFLDQADLPIFALLDKRCNSLVPYHLYTNPVVSAKVSVAFFKRLNAKNAVHLRSWPAADEEAMLHLTDDEFERSWSLMPEHIDSLNLMGLVSTRVGWFQRKYATGSGRLSVTALVLGCQQFWGENAHNAINTEQRFVSGYQKHHISPILAFVPLFRNLTVLCLHRATRRIGGVSEAEWEAIRDSSIQVLSMDFVWATDREIDAFYKVMYASPIQLNWELSKLGKFDLEMLYEFFDEWEQEQTLIWPLSMERVSVTLPEVIFPFNLGYAYPWSSALLKRIRYGGTLVIGEKEKHLELLMTCLAPSPSTGDMLSSEFAIVLPISTLNLATLAENRPQFTRLRLTSVPTALRAENVPDWHFLKAYEMSNTLCELSIDTEGVGPRYPTRSSLYHLVNLRSLRILTLNLGTVDWLDGTPKDKPCVPLSASFTANALMTFLQPLPITHLRLRGGAVCATFLASYKHHLRCSFLVSWEWRNLHYFSDGQTWWFPSAQMDQELGDMTQVLGAVSGVRMDWSSLVVDYGKKSGHEKYGLVPHFRECMTEAADKHAKIEEKKRKDVAAVVEAEEEEEEEEEDLVLVLVVDMDAGDVQAQ